MRTHALSLGIIAALVAPGGLVGCGVLRGAPRTVEQPLVHVAGLPLSPRASVGTETRAVVWVSNDGPTPVLVLGVTPQSASDTPVTLLERVSGGLPYDGTTDRFVLTRPRYPGERVALQRGLLLPGEALPLYTDLVPLAPGRSTHRLRLDYLSAPWSEMGPNLYAAGSEPREDGSRVLAPLPADRGALPPGLRAPKLRRVVLARGQDTLVRRAVHFAVELDGVEARQGPRPFAEALELAGQPTGAPARYSDRLSGWAFERADAVRIVRDDGGLLDLRGLTLSALRTIDGHAGPVPVVFDDERTYEVLASLIDTDDGPHPRMAVVRPNRLLELLAAVSLHGITLTTLDPDVFLHRAGPRGLPLFAHR